MIYLETESTDAAYNLAFEQYVLENSTEGEFLILWQNEPTVVIGQNQNAAEEINRDFTEAHGIKVVRRMTGGGTVYHDPGNLNYSFISDDTGFKERFTEPVVKALKKLGLAAETSGRNDILVNGRKVSGTAERQYKNRVLHHGTLLFDTDTDMMSGALHVDREKFRSKGIKSVSSRVGNIRSELKAAGNDMDMAEFWKYIRNELLISSAKADSPVSCKTEALETAAGCLPEKVPGAEAFAEINRLKKKYDSYEWTYGRSPKYSFQNSAGFKSCRNRFTGGTVQINAEVREGLITEISFNGDFLSRTGTEELESSLKGVRFEKADIRNILEKYTDSEFENMFGGISRDDILSLI